METNYFLLNMMKHQLLYIYQVYSEMPELLKDPAVKKAFLALKSVTDSYEFNQWRKIVSGLGLGYDNPNGIERRQNILGELDDLLSKANSRTLEDFTDWKVTFHPEDWRAVYRRNSELVKKLHALADRNYDVHIILVRCNGKLIAVGNDADRLFEIFGWQTSSASDGDKDVSIMFVSDEGYEVLTGSDFSVFVVDFEEDIDKCGELISENFSDDMVAFYQQHVDYLRMKLKQETEHRKFMNDTATFVSPKTGFDVLARATLSVNQEKVIAVFDDGSQLTLADGKSWRLDDVGLPMIVQLSGKRKK